MTTEAPVRPVEIPPVAPPETTILAPRPPSPQEVPEVGKLPPVAKFLTAIRRYLADPRHWTQGREVWSRPGGEKMYCTIGAVRHYPVDAWWGFRRQQIRGEALTYLERSLPRFSNTSSWSIMGFNDANSHKDVLALFDRAIALAVEEGR